MGKLDEDGLLRYDAEIKDYIGNATTKYSENLSGNIEQEAEFAFRPTAGSLDVAEQANSDQALIKGVQGRTVSWNQLCKIIPGSNTRNGVSFTATEDGKLVVNGNCTASFNNTARFSKVSIVSGHHYFLKEYGPAWPISSYGFASMQMYAPNIISITKNESSKSGIGALAVATGSGNAEVRFRIQSGVTYNFTVSCAIIDLTLIYGEGNEPSTAEEFEQDYFNWFGKPLTYEAYSAGELRNLNMVGIKTQGFNLLGGNGKSLLIGGTQYQLTGTYTSITDSQGTAINPDAQGLFTPEETTEVTVSGVGDDTCLHFVHSGRRNGEYEEHWEETKNIDLTKIKGKLDGTGSSTYVCWQGLLQAGDGMDEIYIQDGKRWFAKRVERRVFQSGDAQSSTMTTDGVSYTNEALAAPEYYLLDDDWQDDSVWSYKVDDWGTEEVVSEFSPVVKQSAPFVGIIMYGVNALDTLRNLTKNFVATTSNQGLTEAQRARARNNISALGMYDADYVANITYENNAIRQATWENPDDGEPIATDVVTVAQLKADMGVDALTQRVANIEAIIGDSSGDEQQFRFDSEQLAIGYTLTGDEAALFLATLNSHQYWRFMVYTLYDNELQYETSMTAVQFISGNEGAILRGVGINGNVTMYAHFNSDGSILVNNSL